MPPSAMFGCGCFVPMMKGSALSTMAVGPPDRTSWLSVTAATMSTSLSPKRQYDLPPALAVGSASPDSCCSRSMVARSALPSASSARTTGTTPMP
jgi:hypothetical protein